jgi:hypothetical protein
MSENKISTKALISLIVVGIVVAGVIGFFTRASISPRSDVAGAVGNLLAENYDGGYIRQNGGFFTNLDIKAGGTITAVTSLISSGTFQLSSTGTTLNRINAGTCYVLPYATTIAASTTAAVDCQATALIYNTNTTRAVALAGVTAGDNVVANFATSTAASTFGSISISGASASTTPGYITLLVENLTGTTYTWPVTGTASGTASYIVTK